VTRFEKLYIGDGVYVRVDGGGDIELSTSNGITQTNCIVLESEVMSAFLSWYERAKEEAMRAAMQPRTDQT
jgi:hypothetical protein